MSTPTLSRRARRKRRRRSRSFLLLLPLALLLGYIWVLLYRKLVIGPTPTRGHIMEPGLSLSMQSDGSKQQVIKDDLIKHKPAVRKPRADKKRKSPRFPENDERSDHIIPNILTFTHNINLLTATNVTDEDVALQANVRNTIKMHPGAEVRFLTDPDCILSIKRVLGDDSPLVEHFMKETEGMYKADVCRGAALYETGGLYFDADIQARMSMWKAIDSQTTFVVPVVHVQSKYPGAFFQAFFGVTPRHPIMLRYLHLFLDYYDGSIDVQGPLGVLLLRKAYDDVAKEDSTLKMQFWQEVLYSSKLFPKVPPPNWGTRRACHFVVVANRKPPFLVPLYSRVKGSRMCGGKESVRKPKPRGG